MLQLHKLQGGLLAIGTNGAKEGKTHRNCWLYGRARTGR
jgi:hypothetical protein